MKQILATACLAAGLVACGGGEPPAPAATSCEDATERIQAFYDRTGITDLSEAAGHQEWLDLMEYGGDNCDW